MKKSLLNCIKSFRFAWHGIVHVFKHENNMRIHLFATMLIIVFGFIIQFSKLEWIAILLCICFVWIAEFFNTAIEKTIDIISTENNPRLGIVKDIAAGAVLIASITSLIVFTIILLSHL